MERRSLLLLLLTSMVSPESGRVILDGFNDFILESNTSYVQLNAISQMVNVCNHLTLVKIVTMMTVVSIF